MKTYDVLLTKTLYAKVQVKAESPVEAENSAFEQFMDCEIELEDSGVPGDVNITVTEHEDDHCSHPDAIAIFWDDLTTAKQAEILSSR